MIQSIQQTSGRPWQKWHATSEHNELALREPRVLYEIIKKISRQILMAWTMVSQTYQASGRNLAPHCVLIKVRGFI